MPGQNLYLLLHRYNQVKQTQVLQPKVNDATTASQTSGQGRAHFFGWRLPDGTKKAETATKTNETAKEKTAQQRIQKDESAKISTAETIFLAGIVVPPAIVTLLAAAYVLDGGAMTSSMSGAGQFIMGYIVATFFSVYSALLLNRAHKNKAINSQKPGNS